jgi:hypothetical protein
MSVQMRPLLFLLLCAIACVAQRPNAAAQPPAEEVLAVYKQMERAEQTGDADAWVGLWSRDAAAKAENMRQYLRPRPDAHYTATRTFVQGDQAALLGQSGLGQSGKDQFLSMRFVREDGHWKIGDQVWGNTPFPPDSVYALIPPAPGAFTRAGAPWKSIPPAFDPAEADKRGWQVKATRDESCLYVRIESKKPLPPPGTSAEQPPAGWPVMKLAVSGVGEFVLRANANIGDQATFDPGGRANSHRHFVMYWLMLERANQMIFQATAGLDPHPLIQADEHFFDVCVPLPTIGIADARPRKITLGDAQWPKSVIFSLDVPQYRARP